jgi:predicted DNA-binding antitoxin AbrB/MazE fold protein
MMTTAVKAIYEHGVFRPVAPVRLKEATEVEVLVPTDAAEDDDDPTGWKAADELIGFIKGGLKEPVGEEHDKHLYRR